MSRFVSDLMNLKNQKQIGYAIKVAVILLLFGTLWYKFSNNEDLYSITEQFAFSLADSTNQKYMLLVLLMMIINWSLETQKWVILIAKIQPIKFIQAFKAILAGVTVSVFTPNRIGEYAGRVLFIEHENRLQAVLATLISSIAQLIVTVIFGAVAAYFYYIDIFKLEINQISNYYLIALILALVIALVLFFISTPTLFSSLNKIRAIKRFKKYISVFKRYRVSELLRVLWLSIIRYLTYTFQLYLLLLVFHVDLELSVALTLIPITYFTMTIIPSIALAELGVREAVALTVIGVVSSNHLGILSATFSVWVINLVIPAIAGSALIFNQRIFKRNK